MNERNQIRYLSYSCEVLDILNKLEDRASAAKLGELNRFMCGLVTKPELLACSDFEAKGKLYTLREPMKHGHGGNTNNLLFVKADSITEEPKK